MDHKVNVSHIPPFLNEKDLRELFAHSGKIENLEYFKESKEAEIEYSNIYERDAALLLDRMNLFNATLHVTLPSEHYILEKYEGEPKFSSTDIVTQLIAEGYELSPDSMIKAESYEERRKVIAKTQEKAKKIAEELREAANSLLKQADKIEEESAQKMGENLEKVSNWTEIAKEELEELAEKISKLTTGATTGFTEGVQSLTGGMTEMVGKVYTGIKDKIVETAHMAKETAHSAAEKVVETAHMAKETAHSVSGKIAETAQMAKETVSSASHTAGAKVEQVVNTMRGTTEENLPQTPPQEEIEPMFEDFLTPSEVMLQPVLLDEPTDISIQPALEPTFEQAPKIYEDPDINRYAAIVS